MILNGVKYVRAMVDPSKSLTTNPVCKFVIKSTGHEKGFSLTSKAEIISSAGNILSIADKTEVEMELGR